MNLNLLNKIVFGVLLINSTNGSSIDCKNLVKEGFKFNLEKLQPLVKKINITSEPTTNQIAFYINPCEPLKFGDNEAKEDRCSDKAFGCKIITNFKNDQDPRVIRVIEMAKQTDSQSEPKWEVNKNNEDFQSLVWTMDNQVTGDDKFRVKLTLSCDAQTEKLEPTITTEINDNNNLELSLSNKFICPDKDNSSPEPDVPEPSPEEPPNQGKPDGDNKKSSGSGFTTFLIIVLVFLSFYFVGGCVYNYHFYDARGLNLIPHLSFWKEVPEMTMQLIRRGVLLVSGRRRGRYTRV